MPFSSIITLFRMAAKPLPPSRWPIFAFIEPLPKGDNVSFRENEE